MAESEQDPVKDLLAELKRGRSTKKLDSKKIDAALDHHNKMQADLAKQKDKQNDEEPLQQRLLDKCQQENMMLKRELIETRNKLNALVRLGQNQAEGNRSDSSKTPKFDLNDPFRATILAEQFRSMFDNEWKYAFETLMKLKRSEVDGISVLVQIIKGADQLCTSAMNQHLARIEQVALEDLKLIKVKLPGYSDGVLIPETAATASKEETDRSKRLIREYIKSLGHLSIPGLVQLFQKIYLDHIITEHEVSGSEEKLKIFLDRLINIVWKTKMVDPPLAFVWQETGEPFSRNLSTPYNKAGNQVLHPVWPAILSHQGGPILYKGIVIAE